MYLLKLVDEKRIKQGNYRMSRICGIVGFSSDKNLKQIVD